MQTYDQYNGVFLSSDSRLVGHLRIAGADSLVKLVGDRFPAASEKELTDIHGILSDGKKASLLDCVFYNRMSHYFNNKQQMESTLFPNYIIVSKDFVSSNQSIIRAVRYEFENSAKILSGRKTFRSIMLGKDEIYKLLEEDHKRSEEMAEKYKWPKHSFEPEIGEHPRLLYYSGKWEIIASDTKIGKISLTNHASHSMGTAAGIGFSNKVIVNIEFAEPKTLSATINSLHTLHALFELSLGHRQRYQSIELELDRRTEVDQHDEEVDQRISYEQAHLYWSMCNDRVKNDIKPEYFETLLSADRRPDEFVKVTAGWMDSTSTMGDPRTRFATAFFGRYGIDRIVGAANMFDLLPESHAPKKKMIDKQLADVVDECRTLFEALPSTTAKQSVLSVLGRVGKASLPDKVYHRADKIMLAVGDKFPDLRLPCKHAVLARNHYVHGSDASFDYLENFTEFAFITDTLEFVFAVSDLLDLGWDFKNWMDEGTGMSHPFGAYFVDYSANLRRLQDLVKKPSPPPSSNTVPSTKLLS